MMRAILERDDKVARINAQKVAAGKLWLDAERCRKNPDHRYIAIVKYLEAFELYQLCEHSDNIPNGTDLDEYALNYYFFYKELGDAYFLLAPPEMYPYRPVGFTSHDMYRQAQMHYERAKSIYDNHRKQISPKSSKSERDKLRKNIKKCQEEVVSRLQFFDGVSFEGDWADKIFPKIDWPEFPLMSEALEPAAKKAKVCIEETNSSSEEVSPNPHKRRFISKSDSYVPFFNTGNRQCDNSEKTIEVSLTLSR